MINEMSGTNGKQKDSTQFSTTHPGVAGTLLHSWLSRCKAISSSAINRCSCFTSG